MIREHRAADGHISLPVIRLGDIRTLSGEIPAYFLGNPLVNEVVIDLARKDAFNSLEPTQDAAALDRVETDEVPTRSFTTLGVRVPSAVDGPVRRRPPLVAITSPSG